MLIKIWYSITWIPSIFQTPTHVWGKSINCLLMLGLKLSKLYFWSIQEVNPYFHFTHDIALMVLELKFVCFMSPLLSPYPTSSVVSMFFFLKNLLLFVLLNENCYPYIQSRHYSILCYGKNSSSQCLKWQQPELQGELILLRTCVLFFPWHKNSSSRLF